jgi:hypothetical protein
LLARPDAMSSNMASGLFVFRLQMTSPRRADQAIKTSLADRLLAAQLGALAFLLGCYELFDPDIWWHLRSGQWILEHHRVPLLDIFTFSSSDLVWVDLHWGFQVPLALAYTLAGVAGMILMASAAGCAAVLIAMTAREPDWPRWVAALCWLPALALMAMRFDPRPEMFSLVYLACFLAVLVRADQRPMLAWFLPFVQVLWVNTHGLFVLGPIVLGCYLVECAARTWQPSENTLDDITPKMRPLWQYLLPVAAAVAVACLLNPYGMRGAIFPLELFPKISDPASPYKAYVDEFMSLQRVMLDQKRGAPWLHPHARTQIFLLLLLPWSFVLPAAWERWRMPSGGSEGAGAKGNTAWLSGLVAVCTLSLAAVVCLPLPGTPRDLVGIGRAIPAMMVFFGGGAALLLAIRSRLASATLLVGSASLAAWTAWLPAYLFDDRSTRYGLSTTSLAYIGAGLGMLSLALIVRARASIFRLLLLATFTYLSFQAIRNINLFGLVAGAVLAWNLSEWIARLSMGRPPRFAGWAAPGFVAGLIMLWALAFVTDRYYVLMGNTTHFGLRERPLTFGHNAARFAGQPGLPGRALVFDLGQTGVYIYHNGPHRKVFMDARLEVPSRSTFQTYVRIEEWLNKNDPRWDSAIARLGDPLVLISHDGWAEAEAALLTHPRWRCIYFDSIASLFVTRTGPTSSPEFPDQNFMASRFANGPETTVSVDAKTAEVEATTLLQLSRAIRKRGGDPWRRRIPILVRAHDLTRARIAGERRNAAYLWRQLGHIEWEATPDLTRPPPGPSDAWDPATGLSWARATYCFRRALEAKPDDAPTLRSLAECLGARGMTDAKREVELVLARKNSGDRSRIVAAQHPSVPAGLSWSAADGLAANCLHLGDPDSARRVWNEAPAPSPALRLTRLAEADLAALDASTALTRCQAAVRLDPTLGEAWYVLAVAAFDSGTASAALDACREGMKHELTPAQRETLDGVRRGLGSYVQTKQD